MAHYAFLDANNIVINVIVGIDEDQGDENWEEFYGAKRTSYNTRRGIYLDPITKLPDADQSKAFRKNYAGIGFTYDSIRDAFIPPKPEGYNSWILNEQTCVWEAPVPFPKDGKQYYWDEDSLSWIFLSPNP
jgi:hypothetical protein